MTKKLTEKHPFMIKVMKLYDIMGEMNIRIETNSMGGLNIIDTKTNIMYKAKDNDSSQCIPDFPYFAEFKLVTDNYKNK
jgi:hypothetical protein